MTAAKFMQLEAGKQKEITKKRKKIKAPHHAIPFIKYAFAMRAQKPFHWSLTSSDTGGVDDHLTIVGWGVHKMVMNMMLNQRMHSLTCIKQNEA